MRIFEHDDFEQAILRAAEHFAGRGLRPALIEKDYYVTEALRLVATHASGTSIFKGGTSLSKGWNLSTEYEAIKADYDAISRSHFPGQYFYPEDMRFSRSEAIFPPREIADVIGREYEAQCRQLCFGSFPLWPDVLASFERLRDRL